MRMPDPYRIKMVEPITLIPREQREVALREAEYNLFRIPAASVFIDLLTDSGNGSMSAEQWAAMMTGDESYAGSRSFYQLEDSVRDIFGFPYVLPTHQGRAAEHVFFSSEVREGDIVPSNAHFDTTRANLEWLGAQAVDFPASCAHNPASECRFKGNMHVSTLYALLEEEKDRVPFVMLTITNNRVAGQPVSLENVAQVSEVCKKFHKKLIIDSCRHAENSYLIQQRDPESKHCSIREISRKVFSYADGMLMSAKKDGLSNIGGLIAMRDRDLYEKVNKMLILREGFSTYGGLAGRDLAAIATGLREALEQDYLAHRIGQVEFLLELLQSRGVPVYTPAAGHAVYVDAGKFFDRKKLELPGQSLAAALFLEGGIRTCDLGSSMLGRSGISLELLRLAIPRRTYTESHLRYVADIFSEVAKHKNQVPNLYCFEKPPFLGHFTAKFAVCDSGKPNEKLGNFRFSSAGSHPLN
jgi:tyrosine phenol-lyase